MLCLSFPSVSSFKDSISILFTSQYAVQFLTPVCSYSALLISLETVTGLIPLYGINLVTAKQCFVSILSKVLNNTSFIEGKLYETSSESASVLGLSFSSEAALQDWFRCSAWRRLYRSLQHSTSNVLQNTAFIVKGLFGERAELIKQLKII